MFTILHTKFKYVHFMILFSEETFENVYTFQTLISK
jgi:hypothetical protein